MYQDYIAKNVCVQKDNKINTCRGKCHLKKLLEEADKNESSQSHSSLKEDIEVLYCPISSVFKPNFQLSERKKNLYVEKHADFYSSSFHSDIFVPPKKSGNC